MNKIFSIAFFCLFFAACQDNTNQVVNTEKEQAATSLSDSLAEKKAAFEAKADKAKKKVYAEGIAAVANSGILQTAKNVADTAPDFTLKNAVGQEVSLAAYLKKGSVVLTWYRGGWCPYCNITLHFMEQSLPEIKGYGANLLALTPELPDESLATKDKHSLQFEVLSDVANVVAKKYGIVYSLTPEVADAYNKSFSLNKVNGDESNELPLAATYIIDQDGVIRYAFLDADYRNRASIEIILAELKKLKK